MEGLREQKTETRLRSKFLRRFLTARVSMFSLTFKVWHTKWSKFGINFMSKNIYALLPKSKKVPKIWSLWEKVDK